MQSGYGYTKPKIDDDFPSKKKKNNKSIPKTEDFPSLEANNPESQNKNDSEISFLQSMFPMLDKDTVADVYQGIGKNGLDAAVEALASMTNNDSQPPVKNEYLSVDRTDEFYGKNSSMKKTNQEIASPEAPFSETPFPIDENYEIRKDHNNLFQQISEVLDAVLDRNDLSENEIEELVNMCEDNVYYLITEQERLLPSDSQKNPKEIDRTIADIKDFLLQNEINELHLQNQQKAKTKNNGYSSDFPSLNASNWNEDSYTNQTKYGKIIDREHRKAPLKMQSAEPNGWDSDSSPLKPNPTSTKEIIKLCNSFPSVSSEVIKAAYRCLNNDFAYAKQFLMHKYQDAYQDSPLQKKPEMKIRYKVKEEEKHQVVPKMSQAVQEILDNYTYPEMRAQVRQLSQIKYVLSRTAAQAQSSRKYTQAANLESAAKRQTNELNNFSEASKKCLLDQARKNNQLYELDLHGLFWEEAKDVVREQINFIAIEVSNNERKFSFNEKIKHGVRYVEYCIITGKGNNSKNNKPILYNNLRDYLSENNMYFIEQLLNGKIIVHIPIEK